MKKSPTKPGGAGAGSPSRLASLKAAKKAAMKRKKEEEEGDGVVLPKDPLDPAREAKGQVKRATGLVMDKAFERHECWDSNHIESPQRAARIVEVVTARGLDQRCTRIEPRPATDQELLRVHSQGHLEVLAEVSGNMDREEQRRICMKQFQSVYIGQGSDEVARLAAGSAIDLTNAVLEGRVQNGMAVIRPPGHHAMRAEFNGFCLLNNLAAAARQALDRKAARRILVVDFDVHHGQATQAEFYDDPRVLYFSAHRYQHGEFWPFLRESQYDFVGESRGKGFNVNMPLNELGMTDVDYLAMFHHVLLPMAYEFNPDLVLVSAGYDAAVGCPEGEMLLSPQAYDHMVRSLMALAGGKVVCLLEGGYFVESLAEAASLTLRALLGDHALPLGAIGKPSKSIQETILNSLSALRAYWKSLQVQDTYDISTYDADVDRECHEPSLHYRGERHLEERRRNQDKPDPEDFYETRTPEEAEQMLKRLEEAKRRYGHLLSGTPGRKKVALVHDLSMMRHSNVEEPGHPEQPKRVERMLHTIQDYGLLARTEEVVCVASRRATREEVCGVHDEEYFDSTGAWLAKTQKELEQIGDSFDSIYLNPDSLDCALLSAGSLLQVVEAVCSGEAEKGAAVIRPPGHHAEADEACGFCIFNNVAVAAKHALATQGLKRVLILDWDVHHGNGIQNMFYDDPRVLYISIHRYDHGTFFPGRTDANYDFAGEGAGEGFNVNIPWNGSGMGDPEYALALFNVVLPLAYQFDPELVLVSAGFDAAFGDPLGHCKVSPHMYGHMTHQLSNLANGKVVVALEGGYNLTSISLSMTMCVKALLGDPMPPVCPFGVPKPSAVESVRRVLEHHSRYWPVLQFAAERLPDNFEDLKAQMFERDAALTPKKARAPAAAASDSGRPKDSEYIPSQFRAAQASDSTFVNTVSATARASGEKEETHQVDSKYASQKSDEDKDKEEEKEKESLEAKLGAMAIGPGVSHLGRPGASNYVPDQFLGSYSVAHLTSTLSSSYSSRGETSCTPSGSQERPRMEPAVCPRVEKKE